MWCLIVSIPDPRPSYFDQLLDIQILLLLFLKTFTLSMLDFFNTIRVLSSLDPDQARQNVGPDLGPNCLQRLSANNKRSP